MMKKNYFAPKANIIEALCDEYCAENSLSSAAIVDNTNTDGFTTGRAEEILSDEY